MSRSYQRPENALKRASEFIDVGKPNRALEVLYEVIKRGKMRSSYSEKLLEPIMFKYLELCVDLKKSHLAKEGLYQYRNIFQSVNVSSLETVVRRYLSLAEERTDFARRESHQAVVDIDDLDNLATPEEILLSAVSGEDAQDRSDRTILTPWVKFLWESYRQCLELLRTNSRVERLYHDIAKQAFRFCEKYSRKTEFRKLCDNLRTHLSHIQKQQGSATAVNLNNPETQQMNLETRLEQLNYAIKMELWQEAYKAIEDISDLMNKSKKMPKPHVMASYYQKLSLVFWKAGNHLFHAASLFKLFQLLRDQKKNITSEELGKRASIVLIATLAIPLPSAHPEFDRFIETEKSALEKIEKLATLLSLPKPPTRISLIRDLIRFNVVSAVPQELQNLYQLMEVEFDPLHLCNRMQSNLEWIQEHPELGLTQYVPALQEMTITRLVKQVAQIYQSITFKRLLELSVFIDGFHLERILVDLVRHNDLQIRVDHRSECIHFGADLSESQREDLPEGPMLQSLPSETIRCQLVEMSSSLQSCVALIVPESKKNEMEPMRAQTIQCYQQTKQREHMKILQRQHIIEERKEMLENQNLEREESIRRAQEEQLKKQKEEEQLRLEREASRREKARQEEQLKQIHTKQIKDRLIQISQTSYGQKMMEKFDEEELLNLGAEEILQRQVEELEKERKELNQRLKAQEKKVDYLERAKRLVEIPMLKDLFEKEKEKDKEFWQAQEQERVQKLVEEHEISLQHCKRLCRMHTDRDEFLNQLKSSRRSEIEKKLNDFNARLEVERKNRLAERKEQRRRERREAYYRKKAEEEQQRRDEELKKAREDAERQEREQREREEQEYLARKAALDRQAELQREREKAIEEKQRMDRSAPERFARRPDDSGWRRGGGGGGGGGGEEPPPPPPKEESADQESDSGERPGVWRAGGGTWREKEKEKLDAWRKKDEDRNELEEREPRDRGNKDIRTEEPPLRDRGNRDIREQERRGFGRDREERAGFGREREERGGFGRDREERGGFGRDREERGGFGRDREERGGFGRDREDRGGFGRDRDDRDGGSDWRRGPPRTDRDFGRGDRDRDMGRGDRDTFGRGDRDRDRDFGRGDRDRDRDFGRGGGGDRDRDRDRDFGRGEDRFRRGDDRDMGRGDRGFSRRMDDDRRGPSRADEGGSWRSSAPPPTRERREERGGDRIERRDEKRPGGGNSWRSREEARKEEPREEKPRPAREEDEDGWTTVRR
ncbi:eukaryotic translation initiation factor 3 subunit A-like isoform X3 [Penaeus japonicus]|uniref:eukaryotic translation initiation factor 3 subunit A-like isoform X3 n=1 Tax=Penaeus japonicus TaxID=27405 RepID=UPI001C711609|nr:eukaryotic translation initiation factor 3 subunit A-like isoform X3 [Penaeus japonicus]